MYIYSINRGRNDTGIDHLKAAAYLKCLDVLINIICAFLYALRCWLPLFMCWL